MSSSVAGREKVALRHTPTAASHETVSDVAEAVDEATLPTGPGAVGSTTS